MNKVEKEAELYKNVSDSKLKRVILNYKFLSFANSKNFNFIITLLFLLIPYFIICKINLFTLSLIILSHFFIFWKYLYEKKNWKMVSDEEKEEINEIIKILEIYKKERKTPNL
jgi:hypothetical protein